MQGTMEQLQKHEALSDEDLVRRVLAGEVELFELLVRRHNQRTYRAAWAIVRDSHEAEDIMQDAYVRAYEHLGQFKGEAKFSTWLTRIAVNEALARAKRRGRWEEFSDDTVNTEMSMRRETNNPEHHAAASELRHLLEQAIGELPDKQRLVFVLRDVQELSTAEAAEALGNVKVTLHRARASLRQTLYAHAGAEAPALLNFHLSRCDAVTEAVMARIRALAT
jgi:RNA polymerase sigma-70 factor, ECF subfamily